MPDRGTLARDAAIYVAGHTGMLGSAILRQLEELGYSRLLTRRSSELDLTDQGAVRAFFREERIDCVVLAAGRVGGILANSSFPAQFIDDNPSIASNVIHAAHQAGVERLLYLGSACVYPKDPPQPIREEALLTGPHVDDAARARVCLLALDDASWRRAPAPGVPHVNVGSGRDVTIAELVSLLAEIAGFTGRVTFDSTKPEGVARRHLDVTRLRRLGWAPRIELREGFAATHAWFVEHAGEQSPVRLSATVA